MTNSESNTPMTEGVTPAGQTGATSSGELLSTFMDGEMDKQAAAFLMRRLTQDDALQDEWTRWHTVRSYMRDGEVSAMSGRSAGMPDLASRVRAALEAEEAPAAVSVTAANGWAQRMFKPVASAAIAATVAMTAIIGVNQFYGTPDTTAEGPQFVANTPDTGAALAQGGASQNVSVTVPSLINSPSVPLEAVPVSLQQGGRQVTDDPLARARLEAYLLRHYTHSRVNGGTSLVGYMSNFNSEDPQQELNTAQRSGQGQSEEAAARSASAHQE